MPTPLESYLRTYRKRSGFSQDEVAFLLGCRSSAKVSRYERRARRPTLETLFAYEAIFQIPAKDLFAGLYQKVEKTTRLRARLLAEKLADARPERTTPRKLAILESLASGSAGSQHARQ